MTNLGPWRVAVIMAVFAVFMGCFVLEYTNRSFRYLKYLIPFVTAAIVLTAPEARGETALAVRKQFRMYLVLILGVLYLSLAATLFTQKMTLRFIEEAFFILAPLLTAYLAFPYLDEDRSDKFARYVFLGVVVAYVGERGTQLLSMLRSPSSLLMHLFMSDDMSSESALSFVFGMFCLYFVFTRKNRWALLSFVLVVLSFKRIAIIGTVALVAGYLATRLFKVDLSRRSRLVPMLAVAVNGLILVALYLLSQGAFDDAFQQMTGLSANLVTMGRAHIYQYLCETIGFHPLGSGLGATTAALVTQDFMVLNAHSDILKYMLELGPVMGAALVFCFYRLSARSTEMIVLMIFLNVLFISDNVSIYGETMFLFYFLHTVLLHRAIAERRRHA